MNTLTVRPRDPAPCHVLIIDDDDAFRASQKRTLHQIAKHSERPLKIREFSNGSDALTDLQTHPADCILLDHQMPGGSGLNWLQKFLNEQEDLAVIMLTGKGSEQLAVEAMKNGAMDYLVKGSITKEDIERAILNALEKIEMRRTIRHQQEQLVAAERQRVMIESLGTACHHIGQPATVINAWLQIMQTRETDPDMEEMISSCREAADSIADILHRLMSISQYRTTPYLQHPGHPDDHILDISDQSAASDDST